MHIYTHHYTHASHIPHAHTHHSACTSRIHNACTHLQLTMYVHTHKGWEHLKDILCDAALGTFTRQRATLHGIHVVLHMATCLGFPSLGLGEMAHSDFTNSGSQVITRLLSTSRCNKVTLNCLFPCFLSHCWDYRYRPPRRFYRNMFRIACATISISLYLQDVFAWILSSQPQM